MNETQNNLLVENPGIRLQVNQIVRGKSLAGELERTLNQIDGSGIDGFRFAPDERIFQVWLLLRTGGGMDDQEGCTEIQLEDLLVDLCAVDPVVTREADCNPTGTKWFLGSEGCPLMWTPVCRVSPAYACSSSPGW